jgi:hypothetical protein
MGSDGQRAENIVSTMEWAEEHGCDYISMYCLIPTQMAENVCIPRHRMLAPSWDYVNGNYVTFFPLHMKPSTLQRTVLDCLDRFYHPKRIPGKLARLGRVNNPWLFGGALAGIWATLRRNRAEFDKYTEYLRSVEGEYYDANEELIEERLPRAGIRPEVPFVDIVSTMSDPTLPLTVTEWEEWGDPRTEPFASYMAGYSPYDNTVERDYPAFYVTAGLNDPRVSYHEPAKWVARLRAVRTNDVPLVFKCELGAGHGGPSGRYDRGRDEAKVNTFVLATTI